MNTGTAQGYLRPAVGRIEPERLSRQQAAETGRWMLAATVGQTGLVTDFGADLVQRGRIQHGVGAAESLAEVVGLLEGLGAQHIDFDHYSSELADEFVETEFVKAALTLTDPDLLRERASSEERELFAADPDEVFDPLEYGVEMAQWTTWAHEMETLRRVIVLVEADRADSARVGNFRVYGAGQWLREALWAATGVVPRGPGAPTERSGLFGQAFALEGRAGFEAAPLQQ